MHKTSVYTLVNGNIKELAHRKQQKSQKVILPALQWLWLTNTFLALFVLLSNGCRSKCALGDKTVRTVT